MRLVQNVHMIDDIGDLPYAFLAPVLRHIQNPDQLAELENNCPQILGETGEIWLRFIKRDIPNWNDKPHQPRDPKNWCKVYKKLKRDAEKEEEAQKEVLKQRMQALQKDRKGHQTTIVEARTVIGQASRRRAFNLGSGGSSWGNPAAPAKTGKAAFDKLRRGIFDQKQARPKASQIPTHLLAERKRPGVVQAPARLVRMKENEAPRRMVISRQTHTPGASRDVTSPTTARSNITSRPVPQVNVPKEEKPQRARLPPGQQFTAPKPQTSRPEGSLVVKRRREEPSILFQPKRRRI